MLCAGLGRVQLYKRTCRPPHSPCVQPWRTSRGYYSPWTSCKPPQTHTKYFYTWYLIPSLPYPLLSIAALYSGRAGADFKSHPDDVRHEGSRRARTGSRTSPGGFLSCSVGPAGVRPGERGGGAKGGAGCKEALRSN